MAVTHLRVPASRAFTEQTALLQSKLLPPRPHTTRIDRPRLLHLVNRAHAGSVTLVVAPAGFGKTTLLSQWVQTGAHPVAWLTLEETENDVFTFLAYLVAAVQSVDPALSRMETPASPAEDVSEALLVATLLHDISAMSMPFTLVLDDYHMIASQPVHDVVLSIIDHAPPDVHLLISSRVAPPFPLARKRVLGLVSTLEVAELQFTPAETEALFVGLGIRLSDGELTGLQERTAGWVAGLHMAAISLGEFAQGQLASLDQFGASTRLVSDFLLEEVLRQQPDDVQDFLVKTALFDQFSADLYRAITDDAHAHAVLESVLRANLFVSALDERGEWYAYQLLFREFLRARATTALDADVQQQMYVRASRWFEDSGRHDSAIGAAIAGGDWEYATQLIHPAIRAATLDEQPHHLLAALRAMPVEVVVADSTLAWRFALAAIRTGLTADADYGLELAARAAREDTTALSAFSVLLARGTHARFQDDGETIGALLNTGGAAREPDIPDPDASSDEHRVAFRAAIESISESAALNLQAAAARLRGRVLDAETHARQAHAVALSKSAPYQLHTAAIELGCALLRQGLLRDASEYLIAVSEADKCYPSERRLARIKLAEVAREQGRFDEAQGHLDEEIANVATHRVHTWRPQLELERARLALSRKDHSAAREWAQASERSCAGFAHDRLARTARALVALVHLNEGDVGAAIKWAFDSRLSADAEPNFARLPEHMVFARVLVAQGEAEDAVAFLERLLDVAERDGRVGDAISIQVLLALANQDLFELDAAVDVLDRALILGERGGYLRVFCDEGPPIARLLKVAQRRGVATGYSQRLLVALGETESEPAKIYHQSLVEPITARELDVLRLIAVGLSNKEIADELFISVSTVKRHITNLYGKLGVSTRTEALHKARQLDLLVRSVSAITYDLTGQPEF